MKLPTFAEYKLLPLKERLEIRAYMKQQGMEPYHARIGQPSKLKGRPRLDTHWLKGRKPHTWKVGPDETLHDQYISYIRHKEQAKFRGEEFLLTFDEWRGIWGDSWHLRGRHSYSMVMTRIDTEKSWTVENSCLMERLQLIRRTGLLKRLKKK